MKIIRVADLCFGFSADFETRCTDTLALFEEPFSSQVCVAAFTVSLRELPPFPEEAPFYQDEKIAFYPAKQLVYHRTPSNPWHACTDWKTHEITIIPRRADYAANMWNIFDKIEFSTQLLQHRAVMLHASFIMEQGEAILFSAPSGVGKSTQARLWQETLGAEIINGDRAIVREMNGKLTAYSTPFAGTSGICVNRSAPLRAIVTLEQGRENTVRRLSPKECAHFFYAQTTMCRWKPEDVIGTLELWQRLITKVPVLRLACRPDADAVYVLKKYLDAVQQGGQL